jgi:hypothetical protein
VIALTALSAALLAACGGDDGHQTGADVAPPVEQMLCVKLPAISGAVAIGCTVFETGATSTSGVQSEATCLYRARSFASLRKTGRASRAIRYAACRAESL